MMQIIPSLGKLYYGIPSTPLIPSEISRENARAWVSMDWQCCLAGSSQRAPRILIFSIAMVAECLSYLKSIETHARAFSRLISDGISSVGGDV